MKHKIILNYINKIQKINYNDLTIFLIPIIIFSYYLYVFNPGILGYDTYYQFQQITTHNFTNFHPFFHTFIEMLCLKIWETPLSIAILQIITFSTMWTIICKYNRNENLKNNKTFILQIIVTLIIALVPINGVYSILLYKDILFSYFLMFLCFLIKIILDKKGNLNFNLVLIISIVMSFIAGLRPNGILIVLLVLIGLAAYFYKNNRKQNLHILIPTLTIIFIILISSLNFVYDVEDTQKDALLSKTAHMLADYDLNLKLTNNDKDNINKLMNETAIQENYQPTFSDPIYNFAINKQVYDNNKITYIKIAMKYSLKNPKHFIKYLLNSSPLSWNIVRDTKWVHYEGLYSFITTDNYKNYYDITNSQPKTYYDNATFKNVGTSQYKKLDSILKYIDSNRLLDTIFDSPALYMYLSISILIVTYLITKSKELLFVYSPNLINILIIFFSAPAPQVRYLYSNFLVFYLLIIILIGLNIKTIKKKKRINKT